MKIFYSNPYSTEKNFGKAINDFCELMPEDAWIVIQDGDMMYLTPDWGVIVERALVEHGDKYDLFGCWTNRLNKSSRQIKMFESYDNFNTLDHYQISKAISETECTVTKTDLVAGMFMAFKKQTWKKVGGFKENTKTFDTWFSKSVRDSGGKIGLIDQLYCFHLYRPWAKDPSRESKHLDK